jgi:hypothetical protein
MNVFVVAFFLTLSPCGYVLRIEEQVCCESASTITLFLKENFGEAIQNPEHPLKNIIYDIACQLERYIEKRYVTYVGNCFLMI